VLHVIPWLLCLSELSYKFAISFEVVLCVGTIRLVDLEEIIGVGVFLVR
jgi:hypothetical protein